ncbi:MAG: tautomerase family protein [Chloroflexi bacterium]|nr:tautomerase family protein [Chloroflexota bacterium]
MLRPWTRGVNAEATVLSYGRQQPSFERGYVMPIVRVEMWPGRTQAQKRELARAISEGVCNVAHTTPEATIVIFTDVAREDWAQAGRLASDEE